ncbi:SdpI family protein [Nonlabens sp. Asnod3-H03]|uniref:DUF1648 domain-containing protein n=1 Tax=Nonlabens ulvanivorans TaxID=906888 RepID=A0A081DDD4_NONUL|nr:SdpI family protein [Nonlabens ulvanivorans]GAK76930.1 hypothetical protein JCM19296_2534 [Nonlabens ulvanivorans]
MRNSSLQETVIIILTLIPFIYLGLVYSDLPDSLPMHWNAQGEVDHMGNKRELWLIPILLTGLMYVILKYVPKLDPKGQIKKMGNKFGHLRVAITLFQTALAVGIIYMSTTYKDGDTSSPTWIFMLIGLLFIVLGNYMPAMKPNYFVGIRTPWTLENENVWRKTHRVGAILFITSGIIILITSLLFDMQIAFYATIGTAFAIVAWTFIYSYTLYKKLQ